MRKVIAYVNATIDGAMAGPNGELDWMRPDPELNMTLSGELRERVDTMLIGRGLYHGFGQNFRREATDPASPAELVNFAIWMLETPKVVFSRSETSIAGSDVQQVSADIPGTVAALKQGSGKDMVVFGGVAPVQALVRAGLVDEFWLKVYPTALGTGQPIFGERTSLELIDSRTGASGTLALRYRAA